MKISELWHNTHLSEVSHKVGAAAGKALAGVHVTPDQQQKFISKFQQLQDQIQQLQMRPDAHSGKYAKEFQNLERQKVKIARAGNLNAFGEPMMETASGGSTSSGAVATNVNPFGIVIKRPSLFGYQVPKSQPKSQKKHRSHK